MSRRSFTGATSTRSRWACANALGATTLIPYAAIVSATNIIMLCSILICWEGGVWACLIGGIWPCFILLGPNHGTAMRCRARMRAREVGRLWFCDGKGNNTDLWKKLRGILISLDELKFRKHMKFILTQIIKSFMTEIVWCSSCQGANSSQD